jgi:hypothetical protein
MDSKFSDLKEFASSLKSNNFIIIFEMGKTILLCLNRAKKGEYPLFLSLSKFEDYERVCNVFRKQNFLTDELSAHMAIDSSIELLKFGAETHFLNRGLFSNYYLKERMENALHQRKREIKKEKIKLLSSFELHNLLAGNKSDSTNVPIILKSLGYFPILDERNKYLLKTSDGKIRSVAIVTDRDNMDLMFDIDTPVPSVQAVSALQLYSWVILTNGRIWRLYSSKVSSSSTNYFEIDLRGISDDKDQRLKYFVSLFGSAAMETKNDDISDLDFIYNGGLAYARELEDNLRTKIFEKQLFLDLVRSVISHSNAKIRSEDELVKAKAVSLKLLYRILFVLYAESRLLFPLNNEGYKEISFESLRARLHVLEKDPESDSVWNCLRNLFTSISKGNSDANLPQYNGSLFEYDKDLDELNIQNRYLTTALKSLVEIDGKGIDYQNLGVRHLGSLYEALLEYNVRQATCDLAIIKDEILDFSFISDLKSKPSQIIKKGELYLTSSGLDRKGTGSYYTPDKIVRFLAHKGLEPTFKERETKFIEALNKWRRTRQVNESAKSSEFLLDIQVVDPAMGSGHFLVTVVDEITKWLMTLLEKYPDAPLAQEIGQERNKVISEQLNKGIRLNEDLLSFNVMLKRKVMKRCVFGVDVNPLAVELAKVSLWLDSFTIGTPLTFLDHHIRTGNSLVGLWLKNLKQEKQENKNSTLDIWMHDIVEEVVDWGEALHNISTPADLTLRDFNKNKETYFEFKEKSKPLRLILDMLTSTKIDMAVGKNFLTDYKMIEEVITKNKELENQPWYVSNLRANELSQKYNFFHWELEFPDAFTDTRRGFDLVITNPPWNTVKPDDDDFFSEYDPKFRRKINKSEKNKIKEKLLQNSEIAKSYQAYNKSIGDLSSFFKNSKEYVMRGKGDLDLWKIYLERISHLVTRGGTLSMVMPSGILNNQGGTDLRRLVLEKRVRCLYEFHNLKGIFGIHKDYKFILMIVDNVKSDSDFPVGFYLHDTDALDGKVEQEKFFTMNKEFIQLISPDSLSIPELQGKYEIDIFKKIYDKHQLLSKGLENKRIIFKFVTEMHRTMASDLFRTDGKGWPLIEGKNFNQFIPDYEGTKFTVDVKDGLEWTSKIRTYASHNQTFHEMPRLAFRNFGGSTNIRSIIACILPPKCFVPNNATVVVPMKDNAILLDNEYYLIISYLVGIFNSYVFDFLVFRRVFMNLNYFLIYPTPIPIELGNYTAKRIIEIAARLSCKDERFEKLSKIIRIPSGKPSMKELIEMIAELNALVAHHYEVTRDEYEYIIYTFEDFTEDQNLENMKEITWNESLIKKINGEARRRTLGYYDEIVKNGK